MVNFNPNVDRPDRESRAPESAGKAPKGKGSETVKFYTTRTSPELTVEKLAKALESNPEKIDFEGRTLTDEQLDLLAKKLTEKSIAIVNLSLNTKQLERFVSKNPNKLETFGVIITDKKSTNAIDNLVRLRSLKDLRLKVQDLNDSQATKIAKFLKRQTTKLEIEDSILSEKGFTKLSKLENLQSVEIANLLTKSFEGVLWEGMQFPHGFPSMNEHQWDTILKKSGFPKNKAKTSFS